MQPIIDPIDPALVKAELTPERFLRHSNKGGNEIYIVDCNSAPNAMREIGRLREIAFRAAGGGTGLDCDIDRFDTMEPPCRQIIVWDPRESEILGGYRFILGPDIRLEANGQPRLATSHMFHFSDKFIEEYLPATMELGRSFVRIEKQSTRPGIRSIYVLDNLWDGLGALTVRFPYLRYLFGKVTMYPSYSRPCRDLILAFLHKHFPDREGLVKPLNPLRADLDSELVHECLNGATFDEDIRRLNSFIRERGFMIPPLINAYMSLSPTMKMFGTAINDEFGDVEESGILISVDDIFEEKKRRHIESYRNADPQS